jgi:predicted AAA+ superfamily ATPase
MTIMRELLLKIALSQRDEYRALQSKPEVVRELETTILRSLDSPQIKLIMGPRRSGKSTIARRCLAKTPHAYFNFEDDRIPPDVDSDLLLGAMKDAWDCDSVFFFDEIQNLNRWEQFLHRLHRAKKNIIVTGSNSKLLSKEFATSLTGRFLSYTLLPFSWSETCQINKEEDSGAFLNYLREGGFPDVVLNQAPSTQYLSQLWQAIISRDIVDRYRIRASPAMRALGELILQAIGGRVTGRSLQKALPTKISNTTLENFIRYGEEAFLFVMLNKFEPSLAKQKKAERKPYAYDTGFIKAVRPSLVSASQGQLLENYVFLELIRRGAEPNVDLFYYQSLNREEVDFVVAKVGSPTKLIQVCWSLQDPETKNREVRALVSAAERFGVREGVVITLDEEFEIQTQGVKISVRKASEEFR